MVGVAFGGDYGGLPPEINSGRIWAGPGSAALVESAAAWQALAAELGSAGAAMKAVLEALGTSWLGPSSMTMAAAAAPYVAWMLARPATRRWCLRRPMPGWCRRRRSKRTGSVWPP